MGTVSTGFADSPSSDPLSNWYIRNPVTLTENLDGVAYGNGTFVAVGECGGILSSPDGITWTDTTPQQIIAFSKIVFGNGIFVAVGGGIMTSPDGISWTQQTLRPSGVQGPILTIAFGNGIFVLVEAENPADSFIWTSTDGITWVQRTGGVGAVLNAAAYGNGIFVIAGVNSTASAADSKILTSNDNGQTWTAREGAETVRWTLSYSSGTPMQDACLLFYGKQMTFGNGMFIAIPDAFDSPLTSGSAFFITSYDGITLSEITLATSLSTYDPINSLVYGNGTFVAIGEEGIILTSADGAVWTARTSGVINQLRDVAFGNGTFVAVGYNGTIIQSDSIGPGANFHNGATGPNAWTFSQGLAAVLVGGSRWGFINSAGRMVFNPVFNDALSFSQGWAPVESGTVWSFMNKNGKALTISPSQAVTETHIFSGGYAAINVAATGSSSQWGFVNTNGKVAIEPQFDDVRDFSGGFAAVKIGDKVGFINTNGSFILNPQYDDALDFSEKLAPVVIGDKWVYINDGGQQISQTFDGAQNFSGGLAAVETTGKWGFINTAGQIVITPQFDDAQSFSQGLAAVETGGQWGFVNNVGQMVITPQFNDAQPFSQNEKLAAVKVNGLWGFIDQTGQTVISPQFDDALGFSQGLAAIKTGGEVGFINQQGQMVIKPQFEMPGSFQKN